MESNKGGKQLMSMEANRATVEEGEVCMMTRLYVVNQCEFHSIMPAPMKELIDPFSDVFEEPKT
jgi:hypothetical protein